MDHIRLIGGRPLEGKILISGAKNAALPLMIAALLTSEDLVLENVPRLNDVQQLLRLLSYLGVDYSIKGRRAGDDDMAGQILSLTANHISGKKAPYEIVSKMRAGFWVIGPLLARFGEASISLPGGCAIGTRPVDYFIQGLERMGADISLDGGYVNARAKRGLRGGEIILPSPSVGATHTLMMAAALANGRTHISNAAQEPEIVDLACCLNAMGAKIKGAGGSQLEIDGVAELTGTRYRVMPDRIEAGTYALAAHMSGGQLTIEGIGGDLIHILLEQLTRTGAQIAVRDRSIQIVSTGGDILPCDISTAPYPGFPTDLQAQYMALMTRARGTTRINETIFENRFMHVQELVRLGASITLDGRTAVVHGVSSLKGAPVMATDLRASVGLVIAGLAAKGETIISRIYHLDRGFERLEEKLRQCGAQIERISD